MKDKISKIIAIGDIHGKNIWKKIVEQNKDADKIIFIGDYFDSWDASFAEQKTNFFDILSFKKENPERVVMLLGNHEYHYMRAYSMDEYSGYQLNYARKIEEILTEAIDSGYIEIAYEYNEFLFTHAGVTKVWCEVNDILFNFDLNVAYQINEKFKTNPSVFKFTPSTGLDNNGDSITQSPIWVRPRALSTDMIDGYIQVVGHTSHKKLDVTGGIICIDVLDYCDEYLIVKNGVPKVGIIK